MFRQFSTQATNKFNQQCVSSASLSSRRLAQKKLATESVLRQTQHHPQLTQLNLNPSKASDHRFEMKGVPSLKESMQSTRNQSLHNQQHIQSTQTSVSNQKEQTTNQQQQDKKPQHVVDLYQNKKQSMSSKSPSSQQGVGTATSASAQFQGVPDDNKKELNSKEKEEKQKMVKRKTQKIKIKYHIQDSKYNGKPLIEPRNPYYYKKVLKEVDRSLPWYKQKIQKTGYIWEDFGLYLWDLKTFDKPKIAFKTAGFLKRRITATFNLIRHIYQKIRHEVHHVVHGFKTFFKDTKFFLKFQTKQQFEDYQVSDYAEYSRVAQIRKDIFKFIPFSFFLIIPGAEILLPFWLMIFPNSIPSQWMSAEQRKKKFQELQLQKEKAAEKLNYILPQYLYQLYKTKDLIEEDKLKIEELRSCLEDEHYVLPTELLTYRNIFQKYGEFKYMPVKSLMHVAHFMGLQPVTGLNTINNLLKYTKLNIPLDAPVVKIFTKLMLVRELNLYFMKIRKEDESLSFEDLDNFSEEQLDIICFNRGIEINVPRKEKTEDLKLWLSISNLRNVPDSLLLYVRIKDFNNSIFSISEDDDDSKILRTVNTGTYFIEKVQVFESTFGIDKVGEMVGDIQSRLNQHILKYEKKQDSEYLFEDKPLFDEKDQKQFQKTLDEFQTRHKTISKKINQSFQVGTLLNNFLEKQIIINYMIKGQYQEFQEEKPEMIALAKKLLGEELYFAMSSFTSEFPPMPSSDEYRSLVKLQRQLCVDADENLKKFESLTDLQLYSQQAE